MTKRDFYKNTRGCIDRYNYIVNKIACGQMETDDVEDEFLINFCLYLAHALIKDTGDGQKARKQLA